MFLIPVYDRLGTWPPGFAFGTGTVWRYVRESIDRVAVVFVVTASVTTMDGREVCGGDIAKRFRMGGSATNGYPILEGRTIAMLEVSRHETFADYSAACMEKLSEDLVRGVEWAFCELFRMINVGEIPGDDLALKRA